MRSLYVELFGDAVDVCGLEQFDGFVMSASVALYVATREVLESSWRWSDAAHPPNQMS